MSPPDTVPRVLDKAVMAVEQARTTHHRRAVDDDLAELLAELRADGWSELEVGAGAIVGCALANIDLVGQIALLAAIRRLRAVEHEAEVDELTRLRAAVAAAKECLPEEGEDMDTWHGTPAPLIDWEHLDAWWTAMKAVES